MEMTDWPEQRNAGNGRKSNMKTKPEKWQNVTSCYLLYAPYLDELSKAVFVSLILINALYYTHT